MTICYTYPADIEKQSDGSLLVRFPDAPEALTDGHSMDEALYMKPATR